MFWGNQLPNGFAINAVDLDGEGSAEYLIAKAVVDLPESGDYTAVALLVDPSTGAAVATTTGRVEMDRGQDIFGTGFWTPEIRKAQVSGPYEVRLTFIREQSDSMFERPANPDMVGRVYQWTFSTPAYDWRSFQEQPAALTIAGPAVSTTQDFDGDGLADAFAITVPVNVNKDGVYVIHADSDALFLPGVTDRFLARDGPELGAPQFVPMASGPQTVEIGVPPEQLYLSGIDGPLDVHITISSGTETVTTHPCCGTVNPSFSEDPAFAPPPEGSVFGLRAPYVLPPTPIGVRAEAHFSGVVHWFDFKRPWMPIEFTGDVQDFGTDMDGDGMFDYLTVQAGVTVRNPGTYDFSGTLYAGGSEPSNEVLVRSTPDQSNVVTTAWTRIPFNDWTYTQGPQTVTLNFAGAEILAARLNGPDRAGERRDRSCHRSYHRDVLHVPVRGHGGESRETPLHCRHLLGARGVRHSDDIHGPRLRIHDDDPDHPCERCRRSGRDGTDRRSSDPDIPDRHCPCRGLRRRHVPRRSVGRGRGLPRDPANPLGSLGTRRRGATSSCNR